MQVVNLIYLGNLSDMDPIEGNNRSENAAATLDGRTFTNLQTVSVNTGDTGDGWVRDNGELTAYQFAYGESGPITYNLGNGPVTTTLDGTVFTDVRVNTTNSPFQSGSLQTTVIQMANGDTFLANYFTNGALDNKDISSVVIERVNGESYSAFYTEAGLSGTTTTGVTPPPPPPPPPGPNPDGVVNGTAGADLMNPGYRDAQNDQVDGTDGVNDSIQGNAGNDTINAGAGNDTVSGGADQDSINGGAGADVISADDGNDRVEGGAGNDNVSGGAGNDAIYGDTASGGAGGGAGTTIWANDQWGSLNKITLDGSGLNATTTLISPTRGFDDIAMGADGRLFGNIGSSLYQINTTNGSDTLIGTIGGGAGGAGLSFGADGLLYTNRGSTIVKFDPNTPGTVTNVWTNPNGGSAAGDFLTVGDKMYVTWVNASGTTQLLQLDLNSSNAVTGATTLGTLPSTSDGLALGPNGAIYATVDNFLVRLDVPTSPLSGGAGAITYTNVAGTENGWGFFGATSDAGTTGGGGGGGTSVTGNDTLSGGDGADSIYGGGGADSITGDAGNDLIHGDAPSGSTAAASAAPGNDTIDGGAGDDTILGGGGNDSINGSTGNDVIHGDTDPSGAAGGGAGGAGTTIWANDWWGALQRITLDGSGLGATRIDVGPIRAFNDIAMGADGRLYGNLGSNLYQIDTTNGSDRLIGTIGGGAGGAGLSFGADGLLYTNTGSTIVKFNPDTPGSVTTVWTNPNGGSAAGDFLTVGDKMYVTWVNASGTTQLLQLDLNSSNAVTGATTLGTLPSTSDGLALGPNGAIYATVDTDLVRLDVPTSPLSGGAGAITYTKVLGAESTTPYLGATSGAAGIGGGGGGGGTPVVGNDTLAGGEGNDSLYGGGGADRLVTGPADRAEGGDGDDVFVVDRALTGTGTITVIGGEDGQTNGDVLDLRGLANVVINQTGPEAGTATYTNASGDTVTINYSEIESILRDGGGVVDGTAGSDNMDATYTDPQGDQIDGGDGLNDTIAAGTGDDTVDAGLGNDTVFGGTGADSLSGNVGNDSLLGEDGADTLDGGADNDTVDGGVGNDSVRGGAGNDSVLGGDGTDTLAGGLGNDTLDGGAGDDDIAVGGADVAFGGSGDEVFTVDPTDTAADLNATITGGETGEDLVDPANGGTGDTLNLSAVTVGLAVALATNPESGTVNGLDADGAPDLTFAEIEKLLTGSGSDTINGGSATGPVAVDTGLGNDSVATGSGNDTIAAGTGDDTVASGGGNDQVDAGQGNDSVAAGDGNDTVAGGDGADTVDGGAGEDSLTGGAGTDSLIGGAGNDTVDGGDGSDTLAGGEGSDVLTGGLGDDDITLGAGDTADGGAGDDVFTVSPSLTGAAAATIIGGEGSEDLSDPANGGAGDVLDLRGQTGVVVTYNTADPTYNPATGQGESGTATYRNSLGQTVTVNFSQIETILRDAAGVVDGTAGSDNMDANYIDPQGDQIDGGDGLNDTIAAGTGDDTVDAGLGNDTVFGGSGADSLSGNVGSDSLLGEDGADTLDGGADNDTVDGGVGNDSVRGGAGNDSVLGGDGTDTLAGGLGNDTLDGGAGDDDIAVGGADVAFGGSGDEVFTVDPTDTTADLNATITGGETGEDLADPANGGSGDTLNLSAVSVGLAVALATNPESGTVNGLDADGAPDLTFAEIEKLLTGSGSDTINGGGSTGPVNVDTGGGNDSVTTGSGDDVVAAGPGEDTVSTGGGDDLVNGGEGNDSLTGGDGDDTLDGGNDRDTLSGGAGNDSLTGGAGNDSLDGGDGADTLDGGAGDDILNGGSGNDSVVGGDGADVITSGPAGAPDIGYPGIFAGDATPNDDLDTVYGGSGADTISTGDDRDLVYGGTDADSIDGGVDNDTLYGDEGVDTITGGEGADLVYGGAEGDVIYGGLSNPALDGLNIDDATDLAPNNGRDTLYGGDGGDLIQGQDDADSLFGDAGVDTLEGGIDNDSLFGGADGDRLDGGAGRDVLNGGAGVDTLTGGTGADAFVADGTADVITDFDVTTGIGDADTQNNDAVDLSAYYNPVTLAAWNAANPGNTFSDPLDWLRADQADGVLQGAGGLRIQNGGLAVAGTGLTTENTSVICFAKGTQISTINGTVAIEDLTAGDMVLTVDNGYKPIRWIGSRKVDGRARFAPIRFEAGVLGNDRPLTVSPQHRVQVKSTIAAKMFGSQDVLVAAKHLLGLPGVSQVPVAEVEYFHFLLDQHELVISEGAVTETLFTGPEALRAVEPEARAEILSIFPDLADLDHSRLTLPVRPLVTGRMGRQLAARHLRNNKRLVA